MSQGPACYAVLANALFALAHFVRPHPLHAVSASQVLHNRIPLCSVAASAHAMPHMRKLPIGFSLSHSALLVSHACTALVSNWSGLDNLLLTSRW